MPLFARLVRPYKYYHIYTIGVLIIKHNNWLPGCICPELVEGGRPAYRQAGFRTICYIDFELNAEFLIEENCFV